MYTKNRSGQFLYFAMTSSFSGNAVGGISGSISGSRSIDGGVRTLLSGDIIDVSNGQYCARLFDFDLNGNCVGFLFTASGCAPVSFTIVTAANVSGQLGIVSGTNVNVWSGQLSGQQVTAAAPASGTTWLASGHPATLYSGQVTSPYSGSMSGQKVDTLSGQTYPNSGLAVNLLSGNIASLYSGSINTQTFQSGGTELADVFLRRPFASGGAVLSGQRNLIYAARKLTNKWDLQAVSGFLVVYAENDATEAYRQAVTPVSGAAPLAEIG